MRFGLSLLSLALLPLLATAAPKDATPKPVDVVLCLDTSNSMDGLIDSAKRKLWAVVNDLAKMEPMPSLRVGGLSAFSLALPDLLRLEAAAGMQRRKSRAQSVILVYLGGGLSHHDSFDLKPEATPEVRGKYRLPVRHPRRCPTR